MFHRVRWLVAFLLFTAGAINYMDRSTLSIAAPLISKEFHLDPTQLGIIFSSFFLGYAVFCFVGGYSSDRFGPTRVYTVAMTVWSIFCGLTAAVFNFASLFFVRLIFGFGEGPYGSTSAKMVNNWFPVSERGGAIAIANAGTPLGGAISGPVVGFLAIALGWRVSFIIIAAIGLIWVVAWALLTTDSPATHPRASAEERREYASGSSTTEIDRHGKTPLGFYLRQPAILATAFAFFGYAYVLYFFLTWFPSYLTMARHLSLKSMSVATVIPWFVGFIGLTAGGFISDAVYRRTRDALFSRKVILVACLLASAACVAVAGFVTSVVAAVLLMAAAVFFLYLTATSYWTIIQDTVRAENVGGTSGFVHLIANLAGIVGPTITGFLVQSTGAFTSAFVLAGAIATVGAVAVAIWVRPLRVRAERPTAAAISGAS